MYSNIEILIVIGFIAVYLFQTIIITLLYEIFRKLRFILIGMKGNK